MTKRQVVIVDGSVALTPADKAALTRLLKTKKVPAAYAIVGPLEFMLSAKHYFLVKKQPARFVDAGRSKKVAQLAEALICFNTKSSTYAWAKKNDIPCYVRKEVA